MNSVAVPHEPATGWMRFFRPRERSAWRNFAVAMLVLSVALAVALVSAAAAQQGRFVFALITTVLALGLAAWVAIAIVPAMAKRTSLRWIAYQIDYRLTRDGIIYLAAVFILVLAAVNTGNNLLFLILACALAGILISGVLSRVVLTGINLKLDLPEHIFAEQPILAELELHNEKLFWPSFSLRVIGENAKDAKDKSSDAHILTRPVFFPYLGRGSSARQKVELRFARRGIYRQDAFGIRTRFPFGFFEKTRRVNSDVSITVYPRVEPTDQFYEILPLLSGEIASSFRGRGHELHSLRNYLPTDSARFVDWKVSAKSGRLMVREFAREDERRLMLVLDPFVGPLHASAGSPSAAEFAERFERAVSLAACIAWHFYELHSVLQFRTHNFSTSLAPAGEIIYDALRELALVHPITSPDASGRGSAFLDTLTGDSEIFKIILTSRPQRTIPTALWSSSYFLFIDQL
ncbi:MAG TPA: DUF58 domain-containing protein [Candidatus Dormibacteraeota bacterium]|nr:DUF58 domain-containing protein [Candidatus Dormibacteraeota bacterium]